MTNPDSSVPNQTAGSDEFRIINITAGGTTAFGEQSVSAPAVPVVQPQQQQQEQASPPSGGGNNRTESVDEAVRALMNISKFPVNTGGGGTESGPTQTATAATSTTAATSATAETPATLVTHSSLEGVQGIHSDATEETEPHSEGLEVESTIIEGSSEEHSGELSDEPSEFDSGSECCTEAMIAKGCMYTILQSLFVTTDDAKDNVADLLKRLVIAVEALKPAPPAAAAAAAVPAP